MRRNNGQVSGSIWPGFVDAMTALLLVLMFVLTIFMVVQFVLRETITGQDVELDNLSDQVSSQEVELDNLTQQIAGLAQALGLEQTRTKGLVSQVGGLEGDLQSANTQLAQQSALIGALTTQAEEQRAQIVSFETQVAGLLGQRSDLTEQLTKTQASLADVQTAQRQTISEKEAVQLALAQARGEIDLQTEQARLAAAKREALEALISDLNTNVASNEQQIAAYLQQISSNDAQIAAGETKIADQAAQLAAREVLIAAAEARIAANEAQIAADEAQISNKDAIISANEARLTMLVQKLDAEEKEKLAKVATLLALRDRLKKGDEELRNLTADLSTKEAALAEKETELSDLEKLRLVEIAATKALKKRLSGAQDELTAMTLALEEKRKQAENTLTLLAAAQAATKQAVQVSDRQLSEQEKQAVLLAQANELLKGEKALSAQSQRKVALLSQQTEALRGQLNSLQGLLDAAKTKDENAQVQIESLGANLNAALAQVASEQKRRAELEVVERKRLEAEAKELEAEAKDLKKFKSEFFGRLRDVLGGQEGIRIVGDRFVFSSEILYTAGSAELGERGKEEIRKVAEIIKEVASQIPDEIDWILRVDGHTDKSPLGGFGHYRDNWELSQGRALSVVKYLIQDLGIPANRLAANGFGEFQPIIDGDGPEALALNRRIELKFTEK